LIYDERDLLVVGEGVVVVVVRWRKKMGCGGNEGYLWSGGMVMGGRNRREMLRAGLHEGKFQLLPKALGVR
jgi:hypothetical protein